MQNADLPVDVLRNFKCGDSPDLCARGEVTHSSTLNPISPPLALK